MTRDDYLQTRGITPETADLFNLRVDGNVLVIPYTSALDGSVITERRRLIDDSAPMKYLGRAGEHLHLFNVRDTDCSPVYLTEGELDTIVLKQMGLDAVGVPGTNGFKDEWRWLFFESEVRVVFDGDDPGRRAGRKIASILGGVASDVFTINLPDGQDVNSLFLEDRTQLESLLGIADA